MWIGSWALACMSFKCNCTNRWVMSFGCPDERRRGGREINSLNPSTKRVDLLEDIPLTMNCKYQFLSPIKRARKSIHPSFVLDNDNFLKCLWTVRIQQKKKRWGWLDCFEQFRVQYGWMDSMLQLDLERLLYITMKSQKRQRGAETRGRNPCHYFQCQNGKTQFRNKVWMWALDGIFWVWTLLGSMLTCRFTLSALLIMPGNVLLQAIVNYGRTQRKPKRCQNPKN